PKYFEIGEEVKHQLVQDPTDEKYFAPSKDRFLADLPGLIVSRLRRAGVGFAAASGLCTHENARRWYSHRRQGACGRMASLIWLGD
ncbi:MAG: laccase domain-containing protein, partial [Gammaproteobacteria bacterium]